MFALQTLYEMTLGQGKLYYYYEGLEKLFNPERTRIWMLEKPYYPAHLYSVPIVFFH